MTITRRMRAKARKTLGSLIKVKTSEPVVALTFDDGPDPETTPLLLDILQANRARATFFMVGESAQRHSGLVKEIAAHGHALGNHSWDHAPFPLLSSTERRAQLDACNAALAPFHTSLFRPPYGEQTWRSRLDAWWLKYEVVGWSVTSEDWYEPDSARIAGVLVNRITPGDIVLLHDTIFDRGVPRKGPQPDRPSHVERTAMFKALDMVFQRIGNQFRFVTVPELLMYGDPYYSYWFKYATDANGLGVIEKTLQRCG